MNFKDLGDDALNELRNSAERELIDRKRTAEQRRPVPRLEDIKVGMSQESIRATREEIERVLRGEQ